MPDTISSFSRIYAFLKNLKTGKRSVLWKIQISNIHVLRVRKGWITCTLSWWRFPGCRRLQALGLGSWLNHQLVRFSYTQNFNRIKINTCPYYLWSIICLLTCVYSLTIGKLFLLFNTHLVEWKEFQLLMCLVEVCTS